MIDAKEYVQYQNNAKYYAKPSTAFTEIPPRKQKLNTLKTLQNIRYYAGNVMLITLFTGMTGIIGVATYTIISQLLQR